MKIKIYRFLSVVFAAAIAFSLATHAHSQTAAPTVEVPLPRYLGLCPQKIGLVHR
jgi:hypothetical protein